MSTTIQDRMGEFLQEIGLTAEQFEKQVGLGGGFVSRLNTKVRKSSVLKIASCYPNLNTAWLLMGRGEMFSESVPMTDTPPTQKERLHAYAEFLHLSDTAFCKKASLSPSFITKLSGNMRSASAKRIKDAFPLLNMEWVESGIGKMVLEHQTPKVDMSIVDRINAIISFLGIPRVSFEKEAGLSRGYVNCADNVSQSTVTKICNRYPFIDHNWLMWGIGSMIAPAIRTVPLVDAADEKQVISAFNGRWEEISGNLKTADNYAVIAFSNVKVDGFPTGCVVLCRHKAETKDGIFTVVRRGNVELVKDIPSTKDCLTYQVGEIIKPL